MPRHGTRKEEPKLMRIWAWKEASGRPDAVQMWGFAVWNMKNGAALASAPVHMGISHVIAHDTELRERSSMAALFQKIAERHPELRRFQIAEARTKATPGAQGVQVPANVISLANKMRAAV